MIVVDVETSGVDPVKHSILSIGAVEFENPSNVFYKECKIFPGCEIDPAATAINGFSAEELTKGEKPLLQEIMHDFFLWSSKIQGKMLAGQNTGFDMEFLKAAARKTSILWTFGYRLLDLHSIAYADQVKKGKYDRPLNLDRILEYVGLPPRQGIHNALEDVKLEAEAISRILHGNNLIEEFKEFEIPEHLLK